MFLIYDEYKIRLKIQCIFSYLLDAKKNIDSSLYHKTTLLEQTVCLIAMITVTRSIF